MEKEIIYQELLQQAKGLVDHKADDICNMANLSALIYQHFNHHWVGFYRVIDHELVLGPFQGPVACTRIGYGKGVCGTSWKSAESLIVDNVHEFPGHIACSAHSNSEIVVPCIRHGEVYAVLDIDSIAYSNFDKIDTLYLEQLVALL